MDVSGQPQATAILPVKYMALSTNLIRSCVGTRTNPYTVDNILRISITAPTEN